MRPANEPPVRGYRQLIAWQKAMDLRTVSWMPVTVYTLDGAAGWLANFVVRWFRSRPTSPKGTTVRHVNI